MSTKKYRPYFTLAELKEIESALSVKASPLLTYISKYIRDIEDGFRSPNHSLKPTMSEKLGFTAPSPDTRGRDIQTLLDIYSVNQSYIGMTPAEIESLESYRYSNDLMTAEEEIQYEGKLMGISI